MENASLAQAPIAHRSVWKLSVQTLVIAFVILAVYILFDTARATFDPNSTLERTFQPVVTAQRFFWAIIGGGTAIFSSVYAWVLVWKRQRGMLVFNIVMALAIIFGFFATFMFVYHPTYPPCNNCV